VQFLNSTYKTNKPLIVGLVFIFSSVFVVTFFYLYSIIPHLDKGLHVIGGFIVVWFFSQFWFEKLKTFSHKECLLIFMSLAALVGFFWEVAEFSTAFPPLVDWGPLKNYLYIGSLVDTLGDFTANILGAALFSLFRLDR